MSDKPLSAAGNGDGRSEGGRFGPGNKAGKGNPNNRKAQKLRNEILRAVSVADWRAILRKAVDDAKAGDAVARTFLANYLVGKPAETVILERIEALEQTLGQRNGAGAKWS